MSGEEIYLLMNGSVFMKANGVENEFLEEK
jgi:hypothetical protein